MNSETSKQQTAGIFDRSAATYNTVGTRFFSHFAEKLVDSAQLARGARVLDIATGSGAVLSVAAKAVGAAGHATGIDLSPQMVDRARETVRTLQNADVQVMDAETLTFPGATFDAVFCAFAIFFFPDYQRALAEITRVLKTGGTLALSTWAPPDPRYRWISDVLAAHAPPAAPTQVRQTRVAGGPAWDKPEGLTEVLSTAGFSQIRVTEGIFDMYYQDEQEWLDVQWSHGARAWLEPLPPDRYQAVTADLFAHLRQLREPNGIPQRQTALFALARKPPANE